MEAQNDIRGGDTGWSRLFAVVADVVAVTAVLVVGAFGYGRLQQDQETTQRRVTVLEARETVQRAENAQERKELKEDIQRDLANLQFSINSVDGRLNTLILELRRGSR